MNVRKSAGWKKSVMRLSIGWWSAPKQMSATPGCIVYDHQHHRIILHIARIEGQYVVVWPREQRSAKTTIMALAIDMALNGLKSQRRRVSCP